MDNALLFDNYKVEQTAYDEWVINKFEGVTYLYPKNTSSEDKLDFYIEKNFIEKVLNLCQYINNIPCLENRVYIPTYEEIKSSFRHNEQQCYHAHECIKDEEFYFYKNKEAKDYINNTLLDIFNNYSFIPIDSVYKGYTMFIDRIITNFRIRCKKDSAFRKEPIFDNAIVPIGLLSHTLHQLYCEFFPAEDLQNPITNSYDISITTQLTFDKKIWASTSTISNMYEALKLYLINDKVNKNPLVKVCSYCDKMFVTQNAKKLRCSKDCTNRANVKKNYYKKRTEE